MTCPPDFPAAVVARTMATHHIHAVIVDGVTRDALHGERLVWGVVSDMDVVRSARRGTEDLTAADLAASEVVTVEPTLALSEAARLMDEHGTAHLVVVDDGRPIGVVSSLDVAGVVAWGRA
jgi:CBS domain-containing protein